MGRYGRNGLGMRRWMLERKAPEPCVDGYQELANAIILQAAKDYRQALKMLKTRPDSLAYMKVKKGCEAFFHSRWFRILTCADPDYILNRIQKEEAV